MRDPKLAERSGHRGYAFGPFVVDTVKRRLWRDGEVVPITSKTFEMLVVLLEHRAHIVSKDELLSRVWPNVVVNENNLARQISSLRRVLGQRADQHDFIVTVPGQGYGFVGDVQDLPDVPAAIHPDRQVQSTAPETGGELADDATSRDEGHGMAVDPRDNPGPVDNPQWRQIGLLVVTCCAVLALAAAATYPRPASPHASSRRTLQRITYDEAALPREASWAPDGRSLVYANNRSGNADLWKQRLGDPDPVRLTTSDANETQPQWSPDGGTIVFRSERDGGGLYVIPPAGGSERMVAGFGYEPAWSPDGTQILFKRSAILPDLPTIYITGLDGKPPRPVRPDVLGQFTSLHAAWHPDGRQISIWGTVRDGGVRFLNVPLDDGNAIASVIPEELRRNLASLSVNRFVWSRSRRYIYFEGRDNDTQNIWRVAVDPHTGRWLEGPERLTTGAGQETSMALSSDGTRLLFTATSSTTRLWAFPFDSSQGRIIGEPSPITDGSTGEVDFDARADGSKVAYRTVRAGRNELWERSLAGGRERLLFSSTAWRLVKPRWSPDGGQLAFSRCAAQNDSLSVAVVNADGTGERVLTTPGDVEMQGFDWSRDGQAIIGACRFSTTDRYSTCLVPVARAARADAPNVTVIASDPKRNLFNQRFSPNQRWITFLAHDLSYASSSTVYVIPASGGAWRPMTEGTYFDDKPRWGPDGRILYFVSNRTGVANVWGRRFDDTTGTPVGDPFPVTAFRSARFVLTPRTVQMDIGVTATHLLLPISEARSEIWMLDEVDR